LTLSLATLLDIKAPQIIFLTQNTSQVEVDIVNHHVSDCKKSGAKLTII